MSDTSNAVGVACRAAVPSPDLGALQAAYDAGVAAGKTGASKKVCPYDRRTIIGRTWTDGWKRGDRVRRGEHEP